MHFKLHYLYDKISFLIVIINFLNFNQKQQYFLIFSYQLEGIFPKAKYCFIKIIVKVNSSSYLVSVIYHFIEGHNYYDCYINIIFRNMVDLVDIYFLGFQIIYQLIICYLNIWNLVIRHQLLGF